MDAPLSITGTLLRNHLVCERLPYLDQFEELPQPPLPPTVQRLMALGREHEQRGVAAMEAVSIGRSLLIEKPLLTARETAELMRRGEPDIHQGLLVSGHWVGRPDLLRRNEAGYYYVSDFKLGFRMKPYVPVVMTFYSLLLERVQKARSFYFEVQLAGDPRTLFLTPELVNRTTEAIGSLERTLHTRKDPGPFLTAACASCRWFQRCRKDAARSKHISILSGLSKQLAKRLANQGISTIRDVARASPLDLIGPHLRSPARADRYIAHARAVLGRRAQVTDAVASVPSRRPVELFLDVETCGFNDGSDTFLWGVLIVRGRRREYRAFFAPTLRGIAAAWRRFAAFARRQGPLASWYCFGALDRAMAEKAQGFYGDNSGVATRIVDLRSIIQASVLAPDKNQSLQILAEALGYRVRSTISGRDVPLAYAEWRSTRDARVRRRLLRHNEDDLRALAFIVERLRRHHRTTTRRPAR